jgi:hypothetical protein
MRNVCPICLKPAPVALSTGTNCDVSCKVCGEYCISIQAATAAASGDLVSDEKRHILSGAIRNRYEQNERVEILTKDDAETILDSVSIPSDPFEAIDLLLKHLLRKAGKTSDVVQLEMENDYPILFAKDQDEFRYYLAKAHELRYIEHREGGSSCRLDLNGWRRLAELRKYERKSDQAFVAMWFDPSLDEVWENGFKPALEQTGYDNPIRIDLAEHNEKVCDRIIAEIRKSALVVADFTGQRGGVYFEAGFAMGLGIPVIWTCRDTDIEKLHFDTRQYNHIVWSDPADLKKRLINRIEATLPDRPRRRL